MKPLRLPFFPRRLAASGATRALLALALVLLGTRVAAQQPAVQQPDAPRAQAQASDQARPRLPKWLRFGGEYRARTEGFSGGGFRLDDSDAYFLNRIRFNMSVRPNRWLAFFAGAQDSHVFGMNQAPRPPFQDTFDLRLAHVEITPRGDAFMLRIGRQELLFGDERLLGVANWGNTGRVWDGIRGTLQRDGNTVDLFAASVVRNVDHRFNRNTPGSWVYGAYASLTKLLPQATVEPYFLWHRDPGKVSEAGIPGIRTSGTTGVRAEGKLPNSLDYELELVKQAGSLVSDSVSAWAGRWVVGYTAGVRFTPRISLDYNYASGDSDPTDGRLGTFDQLYPSPHDKTGLSDQVGWQNIHSIRSSAEFRLHPKLSLTGHYQSWWLASRNDALYNAARNPVALDPSAGRFVGQEVDGIIRYSLTPQAELSGGYAHVFPGTFLKNATPGSSFDFPYIAFVYKF